MSNLVPSQAQALAASLRLKIQHPLTRRGTPTTPCFQFQALKPLIRRTAHAHTVCSTTALQAGAMLIAAGMDTRALKAACMRASELLDDYIDLPGAPPFSPLVADLALLLLRCGWRPSAAPLQQATAEKQALVNNARPWALCSEETAEYLEP